MNKIKYIIIIFIALLVSTSSTYASYTSRGVNYYEKGDYLKASKYLSLGIQDDPNDVEGHLYYAKTLMKLNHIDQAYSHLTFIIEHGRNSSEVKEAGTLLDQLPNQKITIKTNNSNDVTVIKNVRLNDNLSASFMIDTGATYTCISKKMAGELGINTRIAPKVTLTVANGTKIKLPLVTVDKIEIQGLVARNVKATVGDINKNNPNIGLLGISFLNHFKMSMDKYNGTLTLEKNK